MESERIVAIVTDGVYAELTHALAAWPRDHGLSWLEPLFLCAGALLEWMASRRVGVDVTENDPLLWVGRLAPRPLLFIQGEADPFVPMRDFARLWQAAGEGKQRWLVAGAGHRQAQKLRWEDYERQLLAFFERWLAAKQSTRVGRMTSCQTGGTGR